MIYKTSQMLLLEDVTKCSYYNMYDYYYYYYYYYYYITTTTTTINYLYYLLTNKLI